MNLDLNAEFDHSIYKDDLFKICPTTGSITNLNKSGDIVFQSLQSTDPLNIGDAKLYFKIKIEDTTKEITLENNFLPSLFSNMRLRLSSCEIEQILYPGIVSTMLNFILIGDDQKYSNQAYGGFQI